MWRLAPAFAARFVCMSALAGAGCVGCGGATPRPEPPSGAVDPGGAGLATPGVAPGRVAPSTPGLALPGGALGSIGAPGPSPAATSNGAAPSPAPAATPPRADVGRTLVMSREHCDALGRKFAALAMAQAGEEGGPPSAEAADMGRGFARRCATDMAGQAVPVAEYECMLRARAADELLSCKR